MKTRAILLLILATLTEIVAICGAVLTGLVTLKLLHYFTYPIPILASLAIAVTISISITHLVVRKILSKFWKITMSEKD